MSDWLQPLANGLSFGALLALIALGYTMVYGVLKLINFAHGDVLMVGAFVAVYTAAWAERYGIGPYMVLLMPVSMGVCALLGIVIERVAYRPLRNAPRLAALITAIGMSLFLESAGQWRWGATPRAFPVMIEDSAIQPIKEATGVYLYVSDVIIVATTLVLLVGLQLIVKYTRFGKGMRAVSQDRDAARLMGVPVDRVIMGTFALGSALAAAGGILWGMKFGQVDPMMGLQPGLKAFVAAVIGGIGNIPGAMVGGLLMGLAEALVVRVRWDVGALWGSDYLRKGSDYKDALAFLILIVMLLVRPAGLLGKHETEKV